MPNKKFESLNFILESKFFHDPGGLNWYPHAYIAIYDVLLSQLVIRNFSTEVMIIMNYWFLYFFDSGIPRVVQVFREGGSFGFVIKGNNPVCVESVDPLGPADKAGLHAGDVILKLNNIDVRWTVIAS